jgi:hypothetical protein
MREPNSFDLRRAIAGENIRCVDGTPARFVAYEPGATCGCSVVILLEGKLRLYNTDGSPCMVGAGPEKALLMLSKKQVPTEVWINVWRTHDNQMLYVIHYNIEGVRKDIESAVDLLHLETIYREY